MFLYSDYFTDFRRELNGKAWQEVPCQAFLAE